MWHGAQWTYILWGVLHGMWICLEVCTVYLYKKYLPALRTLQSTLVTVVLPWCITMCFLVTTFALFRAESVQKFMVMIHRAGTLQINQLQYFFSSGVMMFNVLVCICAILFMLTYEILSKKRSMNTAWKWICMAIIFLCICNVGYFEQKEFIYFAF